ncbi:MAG: hypothetical protein KDD41_03930 [Flavobacteriales bacterium]|nr:hypothetical protein [Flavobacteriales bacterium]
MNKKKKIVYIMLPIILLVWGYVFFQFFSFFSSSPNYAKADSDITVDIDEIQADTFSIVANYRDPFLGDQKIKVTSGHSSQTQKSNKQKPKQVTPVSEKKWPALQYKGMIKNNQSKARVGILNINGHEQLVKEKQILSDVTVLEINKDFIQLQFQNEKKTLQK